MARYTCERCSAVENTTNPPHLCADLRRRFERQQRQIDAVEDIITSSPKSLPRDLAA